MTAKKIYPKISIITPSFNQGKYIEKTILSITSQNYPNLEYIIMDGGSSDNTLEIINKYREYITYWESKPDNGQSDAIKRGFEISTGDILAYINSDDFYLPGTFLKIADAFENNPSVKWITGNGIYVNENEVTIRKNNYFPPLICPKTMLYGGNCFFQPATFWKRELYFSVGGIDQKINYSFDFDLFLKFLLIEKPLKLNYEVAAFRMHPTSKTSTISHIGQNEHQDIRQKYLARNPPNIISHLFYSFIGYIYNKIVFLFY